jgi:hypothetical protein
MARRPQWWHRLQASKGRGAARRGPLQPVRPRTSARGLRHPHDPGLAQTVASRIERRVVTFTNETSVDGGRSTPKAAGSTDRCGLCSARFSRPTI